MINFRTWKCITLPLNEVIWKYLPDLVLHASPGSQNGDFFQCLDPHFLALPRQLNGFPRRGLRIVEKYYHKAFWKTCYPWDETCNKSDELASTTSTDLNGPQWPQQTSTTSITSTTSTTLTNSTIFDDSFWWQFWWWFLMTKDSPRDLTFETLTKILTIENLNSGNHSYLTINCDTGQHSQFLRCLAE